MGWALRSSHETVGACTSSLMRWWTLMRCSSALCLEEVPLMQSSLFFSCWRSSLQVKKNLLNFAFVDLEKAFDRVPRKVLWRTVRSPGVEEWALHVIQGMYSIAGVVCGSMVSTVEEFGMGAGVHQGFVLSLLLFILVLGRTAVPRELLYPDDLVLTQTPKRSVSPRSRCEKLAWNVKWSVSTWRGPGSWGLFH